MPNWIPFDINWLEGAAHADGWLKTTALAVFEHGGWRVGSAARPGGGRPRRWALSEPEHTGDKIAGAT